MRALGQDEYVTAGGHLRGRAVAPLVQEVAGEERAPQVLEEHARRNGVGPELGIEASLGRAVAKRLGDPIEVLRMCGDQGEPRRHGGRTDRARGWPQSCARLAVADVTACPSGDRAAD